MLNMLRSVWIGSRYLLIAGAVSLAAASSHAQFITFPTSSNLTDNLTNQGSPTLLSFGQASPNDALYYVNHGSAPNDIMYDYDASGDVISTLIGVYAGQLPNVGAANLNGQTLLAYVNTNQQVEFAMSPTGYSNWSYIQPSSSELGTGSASPATWCSPTLVNDANGDKVYVATVGTDGRVYISSTTNGQTFTPVSGNGVSVSSYTTVSQPALVMWGSTPWVAFTNGSRDAVVGSALGSTAGVAGSGYVFGNSNHNGHYAGLSMVSYGNNLYVFGQSTASSQYLQQMYTQNGTSWSGIHTNDIQERWSPSLITTVDGVVLAIQDDNNTNITIYESS